MDVLTGAVVGICFAVTTLMVIADVFNKRSAFWRPMERENSTNSQENRSTHTSSVTVPISPFNNEILDMSQREPFAMIDNNIPMDEPHTRKTQMQPGGQK